MIFFIFSFSFGGEPEGFPCFSRCLFYSFTEVVLFVCSGFSLVLIVTLVGLIFVHNFIIIIIIIFIIIVQELLYIYIFVKSTKTMWLHFFFLISATLCLWVEKLFFGFAFSCLNFLYFFSFELFCSSANFPYSFSHFVIPLGKVV